MKADIISVRDIFETQTSYRIPHFQRPYCWEKERQWEPLWEDIKSLATYYSENGEIPRSHFLGAIVIQQQSSGTGEVQKRRVIDGQQRLSTIQIVLKAAATALREIGEIDRSERLEELTRNRNNRSGGDPSNLVKIRQTNHRDRDAFRIIMEEQADDDPPINEHPIGQAYRYFRSEIEDWLQAPSLMEPKPRAECLESALCDQLQIATVDLDEEDEPYTIFATLNERGVNLGSSDIIKNMLMQKCDVGEDEKAACRVWGKFEADEWWPQKTSENNVERTQTDRFLDHWLSIKTSRYLRPPERLTLDFNHFLFDKTSDELWTLVDEISQFAVHYQEIQEGMLEGVSVTLQRLHVLNVGAPMIMMLAMCMCDLPAHLQKRIAQVTESYVVRRHLIGLATNPLPRTFAGLTQLIMDAELTELDQLVKVAVSHLDQKEPYTQRWPSDDELREYLCNNPMKGSPARQKTILAAIEQHLRDAWTEPLGDTSNLTLEHIMPQNWEEHWPIPQGGASLVRDRDNAIKSIGNLTLITQKLNSSTRNLPWKEKRTKLEAFSTLTLNQRLLKDAPPDWNEDAINVRSRMLSNVATQVWPGPEAFLERE